MIHQTKIDNFMERLETIGNSVSFYLLLLITGLGIWILTPLAPDWRPDGKIFGSVATVLALLTMLHGALWFVLTRESVKLPQKLRAMLALSVRFLRPLHMMTGLLALGIILIHGYAFLKTGLGWNADSITGLVSLIVLFIMAIDGIGLMASPLLSRIVHRFTAVVFVITLFAHLWVVN